MSTRVLGTICIVASLFLGLNGIRWVVIGQEDFDTLASIAAIFWTVGGICALVGMIRQDAVGSNAIVRALALLPIIGFVALLLHGILELAGIVTQGSIAAVIAWLLLLTGMVPVGILTVAARVWEGWRRFAPLLCTVIVPVAFSFSFVVGEDSLTTLAIAIAWMLLGYAVATAESVPGLNPAQA